VVYVGPVCKFVWCEPVQARVWAVLVVVGSPVFTSRVAEKALVDPAIAGIKMWRKVVLNPFSHSTPVNLAAAEVAGAIDAVDKLKVDFDTHIPK
jgi:Zn-dependent protease